MYDQDGGQSVLAVLDLCSYFTRTRLAGHKRGEEVFRDRRGAKTGLNFKFDPLA